MYVRMCVYLHVVTMQMYVHWLSGHQCLTHFCVWVCGRLVTGECVCLCGGGEGSFFFSSIYTCMYIIRVRVYNVVVYKHVLCIHVIRLL